MTSESVPTDDNLPEAHQSIMRATYRALCNHGFAEMTMQDIADEADKSTAVLHYHYDTKENLLVEFLAYMLTRLDEQIAEMEGASATERLQCLFRRLSPDEGDADREQFYRALLELRAQAPYREAYREQLRANKASIQQMVADIVRNGIETGEFRPVDPEQTARLVLAALDGARGAAIALGDEEDPRAVREGLNEFVLDSLRRENGENGENGESGDDTEVEE
ncbi:transcriptional regulator, TetR family [Halogranum rubrum]|uniref:Transcriptional regulator, TetR family n=1 Tax=Halogranum rubrum TaxID=553466 RepID=A0A1I4CH68_9EURY|nr:TetR family transcriptional regulator C-terminal domain-containing protein [Halogranum rubrum]SFK80093.1 transcriptional regulator, TetR family [Halogranum rubrum]